MKNIKKLCLFVLVFFLSIIFIGCNKEKEPDDGGNELPPESNPEEEVENIIDHEVYQIMVGTVYETDVHVFTSSIEGPTIFILGGTHGDEIAGWNTALRLLDRKDFIGKVIIIPKANVLACEQQVRYASGYQDLNRAFPGKEDGKLTEKLAYAICQEVIKYNPKYVIDLHESRSSYSSDSTARLGDELLYCNGKSSILCDDIITEYNSNIDLGETRFNVEGPGVAGSFNEFYGVEFGAYGFTIETNRKLDLETRINQQTKILEILFSIAWNE